MGEDLVVGGLVLGAGMLVVTSGPWGGGFIYKVMDGPPVVSMLCGRQSL